MAHILVVEDEPNLRMLITRLLRDAGYQVSAAATGSAGLQAALGAEHDLVVLDLILPDLSGEEVLRVLLAARPDARILILSSVSEVGRRVAVLDRGAADFVAKPFVNAEFLARVRLRIRDQVTGARPAPYTAVGAGVHLDVHRRELVIDGRRVSLSHREFALLAHLLRRRGEVCTRQELLADVWRMASDPGTNVVDVYVGRLRAKLANDTIETVRNVGYRLLAS
ncbi:MAG: two-component system, OmpR family, response regulator [Pseudonocardiales bacterium]|jgi:DNA-binding response OmpR family regulator|nr:two-component system, OmpR family, response regulator [Pseudonocardiales bacterium]MDT4972493.1 two-component system, OmpR family, response regulator [Pseudonocardiales bacterium]MDT4979406.1 two-component system, OmpR family, response regulator [Pseudonocardiales bacterium]MDT4984343.1 two-component system, OmpR family, response regulator [Pseudonocardiales bacterium]